MRVTVLGGCGAWPAAGQACSGYLVEYDGFRLLVDPGYATLPRLFSYVTAAEVDAVLVSHGHPDHCADLHPLLRARAYAPRPLPALAVYAPADALTAVLALDRPGSLEHTYALRPLVADTPLMVGPFQLDCHWLPHFVPNAGLRVSAGGRVLAYTGDTGPSPEVVRLARGADLFLAEATFAEQVPEPMAAFLSTGRHAGEYAAAAGVGRLWLTHLWPDAPAEPVVAAARDGFAGPVAVARAGTVIDLAAPDS